MTEAEWNACADPKRMIAFVGPMASDRKLRLCACACCRKAEHRIRYEWDRRTLEAVELFLEGRLPAEKATEVWRQRNEELRRLLEAHSCGEHLPSNAAGGAVSWASLPLDPDEPENERKDPRRRPLVAAEEAAWWAGRADIHGVRGEKWTFSVVDGAPATALCGIVRDIFGSIPFRTVTIAPACLTQNVVALALAIYDDRRFADLPRLADALESAGCSDAAILAHGRQPGDHVRGCWVVDLLLGKT